MDQDKITSVQLSRPYLTANAISYLHNQTIPDYSIYKQRISQVVNFLSNLTKTLKFPTRTLASAMLYYQKYYLYNNFSTAANLDVAVCALFLASKNEDTIKKLRDIVFAANPLRNISNSNEAVEENRKLVLTIEKKMLETIGFDFRTYHVDEILIKIAKTLGISFDLSYLAYIILYDSYQTEIGLKVPAHAIALALIIIAGKFMEQVDIFPIKSDEFYCDRDLVNEAIFEILELYINNYNYGNLVNIYPNDKEKFIKIRINMKSENQLNIIEDTSLRNDKYFTQKNFAISESGSARYMLGKQLARFYREYDVEKKGEVIS